MSTAASPRRAPHRRGGGVPRRRPARRGAPPPRSTRCWPSSTATSSRPSCSARWSRRTRRSAPPSTSCAGTCSGCAARWTRSPSRSGSASSRPARCRWSTRPATPSRRARATSACSTSTSCWSASSTSAAPRCTSTCPTATSPCRWSAGWRRTCPRCWRSRPARRTGAAATPATRATATHGLVALADGGPARARGDRAPTTTRWSAS